MAVLGLVNIGALVTGILAAPRLEAEAIVVDGGRIAAIGSTSRTGAAGADVVVDCQGTTVIPGLDDSHCHVVLGGAGARPRRPPREVWLGRLRPAADLVVCDAPAASLARDAVVGAAH